MDKILKQKPIKASRLGCQFSMTVLALGGREVHFPINFSSFLLKILTALSPVLTLHNKIVDMEDIAVNILEIDLSFFDYL